MKTALLLLHGYPFNHALWDAVVPRIAPGVRVLAPDIPGFGGAPVPPTAPSLETLADGMAELLTREHIGRAVVAGMSMGGYIALALAERHKDRLAGLALVSSQPYKDSAEARDGRRTMIERVRREGPEAAGAAMVGKVFASPDESRPAMTEIVRSGAESAGEDGICWALEAMALRPDRGDVLRTLDVPAQTIHGGRDRIVPIELARTFARWPCDGALTEIATAGHMTPIEDPAAVASGLNELIARCA